MTEIENLKDKMMLVKNAVNYNNLETTESPTNDFIFYYSVFSDEALTLLNYPAEFDKILASFKSVV